MRRFNRIKKECLHDKEPDGAVHIPLGHGQCAIVDMEDYPTLIAYNWMGGRYAYTVIGGRKNPQKIYMHQLILSTPNGRQVDHRDRNRMNNRRINLRPATASEQGHNKSVSSSSTTGYKGVSRSGNNFCAYIKTNGHRIILGTFITAEGAAYIYDDAARIHFGEFAACNLPPDPQKVIQAKLRQCKRRGHPLHIGVYRRGDKWAAQFKKDGAWIHLGLFATEQEAYQVTVLATNGDFTKKKPGEAQRKFTAEQILDIRKMRRDKVPYSTIATYFSTCIATIQSIVSYRSYKDIP